MIRWLGLCCLIGCTAVDTEPGDTDTDVKPTCDSPGSVSVLAEALGATTEGATMSPDGDAYVVAKTGLLHLNPSGESEAIAAFGGGVGAAWWRGNIWVAVWEDDQGDPIPGLLRISPMGDVTRFPTESIAKPNFLTVTPWGTLLIADDFDTKIFEFDESGTITEWATDVVSPNGMAFSPDASVLYVASTFGSPALSSIAVDGESAGTRTELTTFESLSTPDGIAVASDGSVLVALNVLHRIDVWRDGEAHTLATDVTAVASLAYGTGDFDPCGVLATSLFSEDVRWVTTGVPGFIPDWLDAP